MHGIKCLVLGIVWLVNFGQAAALTPHQLRVLGPQGVNLWRLEANTKARQKKTALAKDDGLTLQDVPQVIFGPKDVREKYDFRAEWFQQPLDHFDKTSKHTFHQRYWVNSRHYKPRKGAPVIVLDGGETSGEVSLNATQLTVQLHESCALQDRFPFLDTGIVEILARATGGLGVVLEHRYYGGWCPFKVLQASTLSTSAGESIPVSNFSTDSLR